MPKRTKVVPLRPKNPGGPSADELAHRIIFRIGGQRFAIDLVGRVTSLPPATGDGESNVVPIKKRIGQVRAMDSKPKIFHRNHLLVVPDRAMTVVTADPPPQESMMNTSVAQEKSSTLAVVQPVIEKSTAKSQVAVGKRRVAVGKSVSTPRTASRKSPGKARDVVASTRQGGKTAKVLVLLRRPQGATLQELMKATKWQAHSVRGFLSGTLRKRMGLKVTSTKGGDKQRQYSLSR